MFTSHQYLTIIGFTPNEKPIGQQGNIIAEEIQEQSVDRLELATELTVAWLGNPNVRAAAEEVPAFLKAIHATIGELAGSEAAAPAEEAPEYVPAVSPRSSVKGDYIVSLITGQKLKSLKRHLASHGLTPAQYRERYGLRPDYPMVAPAYSEQRRQVAKKLGLGRKPGQTSMAAAQAAPTPISAAAPAKAAPKRAAKPKAAAKPAAQTSAKPAPAKRGRSKKAAAPAV